MKSAYEDLHAQMHALYDVYLFSVPEHLLNYPAEFADEYEEIRARHEFARKWTAESNGWVYEEYDFLWQERFHLELQYLGSNPT